MKLLLITTVALAAVAGVIYAIHEIFDRTSNFGTYEYFTINGTAYDQDLAELMLKYERVAYCEQHLVQDFSCGPDCSSLEGIQDIYTFYNSTYDAFFYSAYDSVFNIIIVAFRGSSDFTNWIQDFKLEEIPYADCQNCQVHLGFHETYLNLREQMLSIVNNMTEKYPNASLGVTGHSLGAGLATLAAVDILLVAGKQIDYLYNFGSPRVGNEAFATYYDSLFPHQYRVVNYKDIIPRLAPMNSGEWQYYHVATEVWLQSNFISYKICNVSGEDPTCSDSVLIPSFFDHLNYFDQVTSCRQQPGQNLSFAEKMVISFEANIQTFESYFTNFTPDINQLVDEFGLTN